MSTMIALKFDDSLIPQTSTIVISATMPNASTLKTIGNADDVRRGCKCLFSCGAIV